MPAQPYTHAMWRVEDGNQERFILAWSALSEAFSSLARPPLWGSLLQSVTDPTLFYSFGPWQSLEDVGAMRVDPVASAAIERVRSLCVEATPGAYRLVRHVGVHASAEEAGPEPTPPSPT